MAPQIYTSAENPLPQDSRRYLLVGAGEGDDMVKGFNRMKRILARQHPSDHWQAKLTEGVEHNEAFRRSKFAEAVLWLLKPAPDTRKLAGSQ